MGPMEATRWEVWVWYSPLCYVLRCHLGPPGLPGHILDLQILQTILLEGITHLWLPTHPHRQPHSPPTCSSPYTCNLWYYSSRGWKSCSVSYIATIGGHETLAKNCSSYTVDPAWLQSSTREPWGLQYLKLVFLKTPIVTLWSVFPYIYKYI